MDLPKFGYVWRKGLDMDCLFLQILYECWRTILSKSCAMNTGIINEIEKM